MSEFLVIVAQRKRPGSDILVATVVLSILAHGLTANPLAAAFGARARSQEGGDGL